VNSRELVYRAIERRGPARVPINYCNRDFQHSDTLCTGVAAARGFVPSRKGMTEWGYVWETLDGTMGQPHGHPLADWENFTHYTPPDPSAPGRLDHVPAWVEKNSGKFLRFGAGITGFNQATFLRGFENFLMDCATEPARVAALLDIVFGYENGIIDRLAGLRVDAVSFADDWGTQQGLMISPKVWREVFAPRYAEQFARVHRQGKKVWFHSCGNIHAIIGDLIAVGVDVLELLQPDVFGVERLAAEFGGKVCFCCSVDHQRRAISGTREEIFAYAARLKDKLGAFNGGFIAYVEDYACLGMSAQNYQWIREAFHGLK
jgi:hypothetical protein